MSQPEAAAQPQAGAAGRPARAHRVLVSTLLALATLVGVLAALSVWVHRQALNTDAWAETSGKLLANEQIQQALGAYLVDQLFDNVDVAAVLQQRLPKQLQVAAGPAAAGLRELAGRAAPELLARPRVQDVANAISGLALILPVLMIILFAVAIWLARGWRRRALRTAGWCFVVIGVLVLLIRRVTGNQVVDNLVKVPSNAPAVHEVWNVATSLLYGIAVALIVYGIVFVLCAALAGPTRPATFLRKALAPTLRDRPGVAYGAVGGLLLLLVLWGPTPAFRQLAWIALFAVLLALGVTVLRGQTAAEFPAVQPGEALRELRERRAAARSRDVETSRIRHQS